MEWVETTGRSVEEALETALDQLGVDEHDAEVEVMQQAQRGLFRRMRSEARIRARVRPSVPPPKLDRRDRRRRDRNGRDGERSRSRPKGQSNGRSTAGGPKAAKGRDGNKERVKDRNKATASARQRRDGSGAGQDAAAVPDNGRASDDAMAQQSGKSSRSRRRRRSRRRGGNAEGAREVSDSTATDTERPVVLDIEAQRAAVEDFLEGLVGAFDRDDVTVTTTVDDETIEAAVEGPELGLLVGQKGVTLQALQELVRSVVQRQFVGQSHARVRVDVAGYRARRREALERFTLQVAESVRASGVAKALDPMGAADRKIVHDAINALDGVETVSQGEDEARHVVIRPV